MRDLNEPAPAHIHGAMQAEDGVVELRPPHGGPTEPRSFEELFLDHHDACTGPCTSTGSPDDAEELMQDAFLKLWERWGTVGAIADPVAWLFRVPLNGFRMRVRHARVAARRLLPVTSPRDPFEDVHIREDVRRMLRSLPRRQRAALVLTEVFDHSSEQAARSPRRDARR